MFGLGLPEIGIIGLIVVLIFGPRQLPRIGKAAGETIREFKAAGKELFGIRDDLREEGKQIEKNLNS